MKRVTRIITSSAVLLGITFLGSNVAARIVPSDQAMLTLARTGRGPGHRAAGRRAGRADDGRGEAAAGTAALRRPGHRRGRREGRRRGVLADGPGEDQRAPEASRWRTRGCTSRSCSPTTPSTATGRSSRSRSGPRARSTRRSRPGRRQDRRARVGDGRDQAGLQPDGRRLLRAPVGTDRRGQRRGPLPRLGDGGRTGAGRPGRRLRGPQQDDDQRQALRGVRRARGRPRLQHDRHLRVDVCATSTCLRSRRPSTPARTR